MNFNFCQELNKQKDEKINELKTDVDILKDKLENVREKLSGKIKNNKQLTEIGTHEKLMGNNITKIENNEQLTEKRLAEIETNDEQMTYDRLIKLEAYQTQQC